MPVTASELLTSVGVDISETVEWGTVPTRKEPGVYVVSCQRDPHALVAVSQCPISPAAIEQLLAVRPELRVDRDRPDAARLTARITSMWLPDEAVLYIGRAGISLKQRVGQYFRTPLGARSPHSGGWPIKCLATPLWVHVGVCGSAAQAKTAEETMQRAFIDQVSAQSRQAVVDPDLPLPFANLEIREGDRCTRKNHGISGARALRSRSRRT